MSSDDRPEDGERELAPCPFCEGEAERRTWDLRPPEGVPGRDKDPVIRHALICSECGVLTPWFGTAPEAIAAWNRRTDRPSSTETGEAALLSLLERRVLERRAQIKNARKRAEEAGRETVAHCRQSDVETLTWVRDQIVKLACGTRPDPSTSSEGQTLEGFVRYVAEHGPPSLADEARQVLGEDSDAAPTETERNDRQHFPPPPNTDYRAICGYDEPHELHTADEEED